MTGRHPDGPSPSDEETAELEARVLMLSIPTLGPARTAWLLGRSGAADALQRLRRGVLPDDLGPPPPGVTNRLIAEWQDRCRKLDGAAMISDHHDRGIGILPPWDGRWPFADEPDPPALVFHKGNLGLLESGPAVAVVGTRRCTTVGRTVAYQLGQDLADATVTVVSGLALGVDGAAHRGCLDQGGGAIAVVGSGLDVVYPGGNRVLWDEIADAGLLLSEAPVGAKPARWRFPARNRLIAALADAVVLVESHHRGGSLLTADEAVDRNKPVYVVPGSVLSSASDGTNQLLFDGAVPVRGAADVLGHLGLQATPTVIDREEPLGPVSELQALVLRECQVGPVHLDVLVHAAGVSPGQLMAAVQHLVALGRVELDGSTVSHIR